MVETATVLAAQQTGHPVRYYGVWKERDEYWRGEAKIMLVIEVGQKLTGQPNGGETDNWQDSSHLSRGRLIDQEVRSISISQKKKKKMINRKTVKWLEKQTSLFEAQCLKYGWFNHILFNYLKQINIVGFYWLFGKKKKERLIYKIKTSVCVCIRNGWLGGARGAK